MKPTVNIEGMSALARLGEAVLGLVRETGLLRKKRRVMRKRRVKRKAAAPKAPKPKARKRRKANSHDGPPAGAEAVE